MPGALDEVDFEERSKPKGRTAKPLEKLLPSEDVTNKNVSRIWHNASPGLNRSSSLPKEITTPAFTNGTRASSRSVSERFVQFEKGIKEDWLQKENWRLQEERRQTLNRIDLLEKEITDWKRKFWIAQEDLNAAKEVGLNYRRRRDRSEEQLFRHNSEAEKDREEWAKEREEFVSESDVLKSENEDLRMVLGIVKNSDLRGKTKKRQLARLVKFAGVQEAHPSGVSPLPHRPALDPDGPNGIPNWAEGKLLYASSEDQLRELIIKQNICRVAMLKRAKDYHKILALAVEAGQHAYLLNNMPLLAKCSYYRGYAEYRIGWYLAARVSFREAEYAKHRYIEGHWATKCLQRCERMVQHETSKGHGLGQMGNPLKSDSAEVDPKEIIIDGQHILPMPTSRWSIDPQFGPPKPMSSSFDEQASSEMKLGPENRKSGHSGESASAPRETQRDLDKEDESVLLRPQNAPVDSLKFYYRQNPARSQFLHANIIKVGGAGLMSDRESELTSLSDIGQPDTEKTTMKESSSKMASVSEEPEPSPLHSHPADQLSSAPVPNKSTPTQSSSPFSKYHRRRPTALQLVERTHSPKQSPIKTPVTAHYDNSDKDDDEVDSNQLHHRHSKTRTPHLKRSKTDSPKKAKAADPLPTKARTQSAQASTISGDPPVHFWSRKPKKPSPTDNTPAPLKKHDLPLRNLTSPTTARRATIANTTPPRRSSLRQSIPPLNAPPRRVSFTDLDPPLDSPHRQRPRSPSLPTPETPRFRLRRQSTGRWSLHGSSERNQTVDLEAELSAVDERLDSPGEGEQKDKSGEGEGESVGVSPKSGPKERPAGIDTVMANKAGEESRPPHVKWAGQMNGADEKNEVDASTPTTAKAPSEPTTPPRSTVMGDTSPTTPSGRTTHLSPPAPSSPAIERAREKRASSWTLGTLRKLMSPGLAGLKRHSITGVEELDEEAGVGGVAEEEDGEFTPRERAIWEGEGELGDEREDADSGEGEM